MNSITIITDDSEALTWINTPYKSIWTNNVKNICTTDRETTIITNDKTVIPLDIKNNECYHTPDVLDFINIRDIYSNLYAYVAISGENDVISWGSTKYGGLISPPIKNELKNLKNIYDGYNSFVASTQNNKIICWGHYGDIILDNTGDINMVSGCSNTLCIITDIKTYLIEKKRTDVCITTINERNIKTLKSNDNTIIGIRNDDTLFTCGYNKYNNIILNGDTKVKLVCVNLLAVAVILYDGTVSTWGEPKYGGDCSSVQSQLVNVIEIVATNYAFMAKTSDERVILWGSTKWGGYNTEISEIFNL
jgi:hypothetical protein